jgi:hypothetical protein
MNIIERIKIRPREYELMHDFIGVSCYVRKGEFLYFKGNHLVTKEGYVLNTTETLIARGLVKPYKK